MGVFLVAASLIASSAVVAAALWIAEALRGTMAMDPEGARRGKAPACAICGLPLERGELTEMFQGLAGKRGIAHSACVMDERMKAVPEPEFVDCDRPKDPCLGGPAVGLFLEREDDGKVHRLVHKWGLPTADRIRAKG